MHSELTSKRILIVEDNPILALDLEDLLGDWGAEPVGPALNLRNGMELAKENHLDAALLDINLGEDWVWPLARELNENNVPFVFISAQCTSDDLPDELSHAHCLDKPAEAEKVAHALKDALTATQGA